MLPGMVLLVSSVIFRKYAHTCLNLEPADLFERIRSWIKRKLRLQTPFWSRLSRNNDNALEDIIVNE